VHVKYPLIDRQIKD